MTSTDELVQEHQIIIGVLTALDEVLQEVTRTRPIPVAFLKQLVSFSQGFIDRCHHGKEERCLFPCLVRRGMPREGGMIALMLQEHEAGRKLVRQISQALERYERGAAPADDVLDSCRQYADLLRQHITKENDLVFPAGEGVMISLDHAENLRCYEEREHELGRGEHQRLVRLAAEMSARSV